MTGPAPARAHDGSALAEAGTGADSLYVVLVQDRIDERIAGHRGRAYASPPQPHDSALALVGLLLGGATRPANGAGSWTRAVPGGRRTITLAPAEAR